MLEAVRQLGEDVAKVAASPLWSPTDTELTDMLRASHRLQQASAALTARVVQQIAARDLPAAHGYRSLTGWLRDRLLLDHPQARELADHARVLGMRPAVEQALIDGRVDMRQAAAIAAAVNAIPADLAAASVDLDGDDAASAGHADPADDDAGGFRQPSPEQIAARAEAMLIDLAGQFPARQLRQFGDRILAHVAPEIAERADEAALRREEASARRKRFFTLSAPYEGMVRVTGLLGTEDAAVVRAALDPLCAPITGDDRSPGQRRADALIDVCRLALRTRELPEDGGEPVQVTVTIPYDPLANRLRIGTLDTGERVSAATARRMACDARLLPVVIGGAGQILDAGRTRRLATGALRRALVARDRGCAFPACDRPARWCDGHHLRAWTDGGPTSLDNLVLLCGRHHRLIHEPKSGWSARLGADGLPEFLPPPWIDAGQQPRRNLYHLRT